jgi:hypothetical protein
MSAANESIATIESKRIGIRGAAPSLRVVYFSRRIEVIGP